MVGLEFTKDCVILLHWVHSAIYPEDTPRTEENLTRMEYNLDPSMCRMSA